MSPTIDGKDVDTIVIEIAPTKVDKNSAIVIQNRLFFCIIFILTPIIKEKRFNLYKNKINRFLFY
ncbi:hypothetical protein AM1H77_00680 [Apilactobacillus micheneri]